MRPAGFQPIHEFSTVQSTPVELAYNDIGGGKREWWLVVGGKRMGRRPDQRDESPMGVVLDREVGPTEALMRLLRAVTRLDD